MRKFPAIGLFLLIPAFFSCAIVGCKQAEKPVDPPKKEGEVKKEESATTPIDKPTTGTIKGTVKYKGTPPEGKLVSAIKEHKDADKCMKGEGVAKFHVQDQTWIIDKDNGVANVVVTLAPPKGKSFKITPELKTPFKDPVLMDQPFCMYTPHIVALYADFQPLVVKNSASFSHNVKIQPGPKDGATDDLLAPGAETAARKYTLKSFSSGIVNISCSMHGWMNAKAHLFDHPYFAVTKADGSFEIKNVPIDTELTVNVWHESNPSHVEALKHTAKEGVNDVKIEIGAK